MGTVISLIAGAGLVLIWSAFWEPESTPQRRWKFTADLRDTLNQAGMHNVSILTFLLVSTGFGLLSWVFALALTTSFAISSIVALFLALLPAWYISYIARKRRTEIGALWPEAIDDLISAIRAGMTLPEALTALGNRGPLELQPYFIQFGADYRATGRFDDCLTSLKDRLADPDGDRIVEALRVTREVGGTDLTKLLATLARFLRKDLRTRRELTARQSWTTSGARLAAAAPWAVLGLLSTRQETARAFDTPLGITVLIAGAVASVIAYGLMLRLGRLPQEQRVLR